MKLEAPGATLISIRQCSSSDVVSLCSITVGDSTSVVSTQYSTFHVTAHGVRDTSYTQRTSASAHRPPPHQGQERTAQQQIRGPDDHTTRPTQPQVRYTGTFLLHCASDLHDALYPLIMTSRGSPHSDAHAMYNPMARTAFRLPDTPLDSPTDAR